MAPERVREMEDRWLTVRAGVENSKHRLEVELSGVPLKSSDSRANLLYDAFFRLTTTTFGFRATRKLN
jgi:hypothetical protein